MKNTITSLFIISISFAFGQIPQGYYNSATGNGLTLKTKLKQITLHCIRLLQCFFSGDLLQQEIVFLFLFVKVIWV